MHSHMLDNLEANSFSPSLKGYGGPIRALIGGPNPHVGSVPRYTTRKIKGEGRHLHRTTVSVEFSPKNPTFLRRADL